MLNSEDEYDEFYTPLEFEDILLAEQMVPDSAETFSEQESQQTIATTPSSDEYAEYDLSEFTAEDFAHIDSMLAAAYSTSESVESRIYYDAPRSGGGGPQIAITLEQNANYSALVKAPEEPQEGGAQATLSPLQRFRRGKWLSVTDLVGPAWCEVQFDYGLRQKRSLKPEKRPESFTTAKGNTITVDKDVAADNYKTTSRGRSVHKVLEREIRPEEVHVEVTTMEERWALRLVNMITSLDSLVELGCCREMPVFGLVHGEVITGIIDELNREVALPPPLPLQPQVDASSDTRYPHKRGSPSTPTKKKKKRSRNTIPRTRYTLHLSDTKTRRSPTLPSDDDTRSSRLQLMLYHRMLSVLLLPSSEAQTNPVPGTTNLQPFDFDALWQRLGVNPSLPFSLSFMQEIGLLDSASAVSSVMTPASSSREDKGASGWCLDDLTAAWRHGVEAINVDGVNTTLTLVYRLQPGVKMSRSRKKRSSSKIQRVRSRSTPITEQEAADIGARMNEPLEPYFGMGDSLPSTVAVSLEEYRKRQKTSAPKGTESADATRDVVSESNSEELSEAAPDEPEAHEDLFAPLTDSGIVADAEEVGTIPTPSEDDDEEPSMTMAELEKEARILGHKQFAVDDKMLDEYLDSILQYWHGERPPVGVEIEHTWRCRTCEYRDGCEWLEQKARERRRLDPAVAATTNAFPGRRSETLYYRPL
ncbi:uncharacterized protein LAESUDRAFT_697055 [Laetiporus sulphureus 93-53]|uniref:Exonuclease V n=1 Tax=Laetiporus sulphureus 93-53 TaxID=1314785 RepID=A0A165FD07_9APHY|nr:uncharacterized protein LAESUDRAFT_697055 [Laetiporus sulphureus 93-53]KZT08784.1 hypothetical protein LAESUDRAFT_697055 [Laetiporus sulphureus 93-53]